MYSATMTDVLIYSTEEFKIFEKLFQEDIIGFSFYDFLELNTTLIKNKENDYKEVKIIINKKTLEIFCKIYLEYIEREKNG